ncbi:DNA-binding CsgD family transcriptional regulator [Pontibacter aydingkolensis]|uniref:Two component regulator three y domain-containing protein n=1 Tax=Pontibacter aydingkolensis TaxID=1911536 RepID=A0ABS7CV22_9BACT|nr:triple tyrosine motif-containing protein [Pontibacter aydingkolensis]MBW7467695.1 two component regulator three y domain-containing protein [Pontibacter aydingkolensis]
MKSVVKFSLIYSVLFVLSSVFPLLAQSRYWGNPFVRNFSTEDFKGGIQSWGIAQDEREVIYVANNFGLLEYDGAEWNRYPVNNGTKVRSLYTSKSQGRVYVGSQSDFGYFETDKLGNLQYFSLKDLIPEQHRNFDEVWRIYEIDGKICFTTFKNIYIYTPDKKITVVAPKNPIEFSFKVKNKLYTMEWGVGLTELESGKLKLLPGGDKFAKSRIASILPFDQANLLIFTVQDGVYLYNGISPVLMKMDDAAVLQHLVINQALLLKDGTYAIGTQNDGLYIMNKQGALLLHLTKADGLYDNTIHTLYQDAHENLWLGLNNGLSLVEISSPFSRIDGAMGVSGAGYAALKIDNKLYLGTTSSLYEAEIGQNHSYKSVPNSTGQVYKLRHYHDKLLMGHHTGPYIIKNGQAQKFAAGNGSWDYIPVPDKPGYFILGSYDGISLLKEDGNDFQLVRKYKGFEESSRVLEFDEKGNLWIAHGYKGVFRIRFAPDYSKIKTTSFFNSKNGLPSDQLVNMERLQGKLYFPALTGIYRFDYSKEIFVKDSVFSSYFKPEEHIAEMEEDVQGNIYFISDQRVGILTLNKFGEPEIRSKEFNTISDRLNDDLPYIKILDLNNVLLGAKDGFIHYDGLKNKTLYPFNTRITKVINTSFDKDSLLFSERAFKEGEKLDLPYKQNSLSFTYSSSFYERPEKTQYQYYLENFDESWSNWTSKTEKEYTNLPEGSYVFHVRAQNIHGNISEAESFAFTVAPPFYRSRLAIVVYIILGLLLLGTLLYYLEKRYRREKLKIIEDKERALSEKDTEVKEVAKLSEKKILRLKHEKQQSEIEHMNRELASSTFHLINKNELLNNVKLELQSIVKQGELQQHSEEVKRIIKNIEQNITSDSDWKQFELHFNHVHGDFTKRLQDSYPEMTPQEVKLSTYLRLNLSTKEIAQLLSISVRGVEISRYRLRKRLELDRSENLTDYILRF